MTEGRCSKGDSHIWLPEEQSKGRKGKQQWRWRCTACGARVEADSPCAQCGGEAVSGETLLRQKFCDRCIVGVKSAFEHEAGEMCREPVEGVCGLVAKARTVASRIKLNERASHSSFSEYVLSGRWLEQPPLERLRPSAMNHYKAVEWLRWWLEEDQGGCKTFRRRPRYRCTQWPTGDRCEVYVRAFDILRDRANEILWAHWPETKDWPETNDWEEAMLSEIGPQGLRWLL